MALTPTKVEISEQMPAPRFLAEVETYLPLIVRNTDARNTTLSVYCQTKDCCCSLVFAVNYFFVFFFVFFE